MLTVAEMILLAVFGAAAMTSEFEARTWQVHDEDEVYHYRLYIPKSARPPKGETTTVSTQAKDGTDSKVTEPAWQTNATPDSSPVPKQRWPLLLWIHGYGERGNDNAKNLRWIELAFEPFNDSPPFFILVPQQQGKHKGWTTGDGGHAGDMLSVTRQILDRVMTEFPIDEERIYVSGVSSGGTASWQIACRYPNLFAAIAPLSSAGCDASHIDSLGETPVWAFHCKVDTLTEPEAVSASVDAVNQAGGLAHLTLTDQPKGDGWTHDSWTPAFQDHAVMQWLLEQRRGEPRTHWPPPEVSSFSLWLRDVIRETPWWQVGAWIGLGIIVLAACLLELRRRRRASSQLVPLPNVFETIEGDRVSF